MVDLTSEMEPDYFGGQNGQFGCSLLLFVAKFLKANQTVVDAYASAWQLFGSLLQIRISLLAQ